MARVVIVGGGISGLAAAHRLQRVAPEMDITLLEASDRLGGVLHTIREDGFVVEGGPDSFLASKPAGLELCRELGIEGGLIRPRPENRGSFVVHSRTLHPIPEGLTGLVPTRLEPLLESALFSAAGKERLKEEPELSAPPETGDESLATFVERRFGSEVYERLIEPLMAGIYAGDGTRLSLLATFPQLREMEREYGSILRAVECRRAAAPPGPTGFLAPLGGVGEIVEALERSLEGVCIHRGEAAAGIGQEGMRWTVTAAEGTKYSVDGVILAVPPAIAGRLVAPVDRRLGDELASIPSASSATVSLAYRDVDVHHSLRGFGYIIPRAEHRPALACTWVSSKWPHRAPSGFVLLRVFLGRYGQENTLDRGDEGLVALAREELRATLGITAEPERRWLFRWPRTMPQYLVGHRERVSRIRSLVDQLPGLHLAGNAYSGVGIPDCIRSGGEAALAICRQLADQRA